MENTDQLGGGPWTRALQRSANNDECGENWWKILLMFTNSWLTKTDSDALACMGHLWYV